MIEYLPDRARIREIVEERFRVLWQRSLADDGYDVEADMRALIAELQGAADRMPGAEGAAYAAVAGEEVNLVLAAFRRDPMEFLRRIGADTTLPPSREDVVAEIDALWREVFARQQGGDPSPSHPIDEYFAALARKIEGPHTRADQQHADLATEYLRQTTTEFSNDMPSMMRRLGITTEPARRYGGRQSLGELAVRSAVSGAARATVWEIVRGIFKAI